MIQFIKMYYAPNVSDIMLSIALKVGRIYQPIISDECKMTHDIVEV